MGCAVHECNFICAAHKTCKAGEWTEATGTALADTTCTPCTTGSFRSEAPKNTRVEREATVCIDHKTCSAGQWTRTAGSPTQDTECVLCSSGRFRKDGPTAKTPEVEDKVCLPHGGCQAGEWTNAVGTAERDTGCVPCAAGRVRGVPPADKTTIETARSCPPCTGIRKYSDEPGLKKCKSCSAGRFGVVAANPKSLGPHTACNDNTCEKPTRLPPNSVVVDAECPDPGSHIGNTPDTCRLSCKSGFYAKPASSQPCTCAPDGKASTASYQGCVIVCTGELLDVCYVGLEL